MLLSEFSGKEIINLRDGTRLGLVGDSDIRIGNDGDIKAFIISSSPPTKYGWLLGKLGERESPSLYIPWQAIKKIGQEVIIVDISYNEAMGKVFE